MASTRYLGMQAIALGDEAGWITVLRASNGELLGTYRAHEKQVIGLSYTQVGDKDLLISAGLEGKLVGVASSQHSNPDPSVGPSITIDVGDRIKAMAIASGRVVVGTEQGFLLFHLSGVV